jgi:succinate-semialdehyde dehydrogenase/glutarate-semialdehyde dehydrogenase
MSIVSINPATDEEIRRYDEMSSDEVKQIIDAAHEAHLSWRGVALGERTRRMKEAARILRDRKDEYGKLMTLEMGKPVAGGRGEAEKCAWVCDYYAEGAESFLSDELVETDASKSFVAFEPIGVVLAVMPWNFPFWQVFRFAAPALMAGNAGLLKHSSNVMGCALAIEEVFHEAGFPKALFRSLLIGGRKVAEVIEHPRVAAVTLTGSTPAGIAVASKAGEVLKKTVLELGGSDPYVVLADADLDEAVSTCVTSRLINSGQSCIAAKRFIVVESLVEAFTKKYVDLMKTKKMGDPMAEDTDVGPQARADLRDELHEQVRKSVAMGAKLLLGGEVPEGKGAFYPPTVLANVTKGMPAYDEELFGPVAAIISAKDEADAIRIANDSIFGLGAAVFTRDVKRGEEIAKKELQAGCCFVNSFVKSDPRLPFGGIKESGYGRELAAFGIREFVNVKTVYVK